MTAHYAVFGNPIEHSLSPTIHQQFAAQFDAAITYDKQLVDVDGFDAAASAFFAAGGAGLNITAPFKSDAYNFADQLSDRAALAGAVNTLIARSGLIEGENTDGCGLLNDLSQNLNWPLRDKRILVLGAGGAVRGVLAPLINAQPASIVIANRTVSKAEQLIDLFSANAHDSSTSLAAHAYNDLPTTFDVIINATSASLGGSELSLPAGLFDHAYCYDMVYGKTPTAFLQQAASQGAKSIADGLGMLVEQAAESFFLWRGSRPQTAPVIRAIRQGL